MTSPTPSVDSLSGMNPMGTFVDQVESGLVLSDFGCRESSSSSSTCSSIVFPHLSVSSNLGSLNNGYCDSNNGRNGRGDYVSSNGLPSPTIGGLKCGICQDSFIQPKVLPCLHTFCQDCLEKSLDGDWLMCPTCRQECTLGPQGVKGLLTDFAVASLVGSGSAPGSAEKPSFDMENNNNDTVNRNVEQSDTKAYCSGCKRGDPVAMTDSSEDSPKYLCSNCYLARVYMKCLEKAQNQQQIGKQFGEIGDVDSQAQVVSCTQHKGEPLQFFCKTCIVPVCTECLMHDHSKPNHDCEALATCESKYVKQLSQFIHDFRLKSAGLHDVLKSFEAASSTLQSRYIKAQTDVNDAFNYYRALLDERKVELLKDLETLYSSRQLTLNMVTRRVEDTLNRMYQTVEFGDRLLRHASAPQILVFKKLLETRLQALLAAVPEPTLAVTVAASGDLEFVGNYASIQSALRNNLGYIRSGVNAENAAQQQQPAPIARPIGTQPDKMGSTLNNANSALETSMLSKRLASTGISGNNLDIGGLRSYETWSNGTESSFSVHKDEGLSQLSGSMQSRNPLPDFSSKLITPSVFQKSSTIKRQKMTYHYKFGEYGTAEAQFTEPSGVAVNANNEIIVADTNNHRIQIFDREGRFKFQFGECGKRDGQLLYPNRVAVVKHTGDIVVTERSPTHQIQIYNQYGQFVRKFGANILQHPRGITVDNQGRVIVVECKVMRVIIFDQMGTVLHKFGCSKHLEFPNGVVVNDRQEIFISDNRAHCVKVFSYEGVFLRQIGGEGLTNYPIGVGINSNGEILVADNHNNFNLTCFTQDGQLVSALESKVKHAQCFDVALMEDGSVVLASKDYRLYIYKYI